MEEKIINETEKKEICTRKNKRIIIKSERKKVFLGCAMPTDE